MNYEESFRALKRNLLLVGGCNLPHDHPINTTLRETRADLDAKRERLPPTPENLPTLVLLAHNHLEWCQRTGAQYPWDAPIRQYMEELVSNVADWEAVAGAKIRAQIQAEEAAKAEASKKTEAAKQLQDLLERARAEERARVAAPTPKKAARS